MASIGGGKQEPSLEEVIGEGVNPEDLPHYTQNREDFSGQGQGNFIHGDIYLLDPQKDKDVRAKTLSQKKSDGRTMSRRPADARYKRAKAALQIPTEEKNIRYDALKTAGTNAIMDYFGISGNEKSNMFPTYGPANSKHATRLALDYERVTGERLSGLSMVDPFFKAVSSYGEPAARELLLDARIDPGDLENYRRYQVSRTQDFFVPSSSGLTLTKMQGGDPRNNMKSLGYELIFRGEGRVRVYHPTPKK